MKRDIENTFVVVD